jgi:hypothetical protein
VKKSLLIVGLVAVGVLALVMWRVGSNGVVLDPGLVFDRIWIDRLPSKPTDTGNGFAAITRQPLGIFQASSQYKGSYEIFTYKPNGDALQVVYPQTNEKEKVKVRAWKCKERDMDYCLEVSGSTRGVTRYRSRRGWEIDRATPPEQVLDRMEAIVRATN